MSDPPGGMGGSLGSSFLQLGLGGIIYKFDHPGGREASFFFKCINSHLSISTKPGKKYLTVQELATGFLFPPPS